MLEDANQKENILQVEKPENIEAEDNKAPETLIEETRSFISETTDSALKDAENLSQQFNSPEIQTAISESNSQIIEASQNANQQIENIDIEKPNNDEQNEKTQEDFKNAIEILFKELDEIENIVKGGYLTTYGSFTEKTSGGEDVFVDTLSWFDTAPQGFGGTGGESRQRLVLIAKDITNKIVGLRLSNLKHISENSCNLEASGEIITKIRKRGFSTAIDRVFEKVLSIIANEQKQSLFGSNFDIKWKVENANLRRLNDGIRDNKFNEEELKTKEQEQKRWQSIYGENGKFGFKKESDKEDNHIYSKIIKPTLDNGAPRYEIEEKKSTVNHEDFLIRKPIDMSTFQKIKESLK